MHCREFRNKHVAFVDDVLPAFEMDAMRRHLATCSGCSRQDTKVRRSLLLVRNIRPVEASPDFMVRLNARIAEMEPVDRTDVVRARPYGQMASFAALAAGMAAVAYFAVEANNYFGQAGDAPVGAVSTLAVARVAEPTPASITDAALVAAVPTGIPVWPTVLMVGQSPMRFASLEFPDEGTR